MLILSLLIGALNKGFRQTAGYGNDLVENTGGSRVKMSEDEIEVVAAARFSILRAVSPPPDQPRTSSPSNKHFLFLIVPNRILS